VLDTATRVEVEIKFEYDGIKYSLVGHRPDRCKLARVGEIVTAKEWSIYPVAVEQK